MNNTMLTIDERVFLLELARQAIMVKLATGQELGPDEEDEQGGLALQAGAFVSLHGGGCLRGCIGTFVSDRPIAQTVAELAISAAFCDPRFPPLTERELSGLRIEISVLSPLKRISSVDEIEVGTHGIYIIKGSCRGVLLPQVATEQNWDRDTFLSHTCLKAGLPGDCWRGDAEIYTFTAEIFGEGESCHSA
ncbi:MAG: AmmeMemoRadiSam system protein A [Deltaproteobacteria bacterium]|nr:AmmeMemoRadiSam system protein A [Deltaproteobacteria bacterium]